MTKLPSLGGGHGLDPLQWAELALSATSLHEARAGVKRQLGEFIHVNSLLITVGMQMPHGRGVSSITFQESAGILVNKEWTEFLNAGNFLDDPMMKRLGGAHRTLFWWEDSPIHRSLDSDDRCFAQHYFDHDIRLGIVDGVVDHRRHAAEVIALDSRSSFREFREFERVYGGQLQLAIAWLWEALRVRSMTHSHGAWELTPRQRECLAWTAAGLSSVEISDRLNLSSATVDEYIASAMKRLGAQTRIQACARATLLGLTSP